MENYIGHSYKYDDQGQLKRLIYVRVQILLKKHSLEPRPWAPMSAQLTWNFFYKLII